MRRRTCAALVLCGPLLAGCGAAGRLDFRDHSRPPSPLQVSVWSGPQGLRLEPALLSAGPVLFDIVNQSGRPERFSVRARDGRILVQSPSIPTGGTAQLKATIGGSGYGLGALSRTVRSSIAEGVKLSVSRAARNGDNALAQP